MANLDSIQIELKSRLINLTQMQRCTLEMTCGPPGSKQAHFIPVHMERLTDTKFRWWWGGHPCTGWHYGSLEELMADQRIWDALQLEGITTNWA